MRIALTGTPCVGKTTVGQLLAESGSHVVDLKQWAKEAQAVVGHDEDGTQVIDVDALPMEDLPADCIIEGHMAHHLAVDAIWLIRCDPASLAPRLHARGYSEAKINENLEAEAMDLILQESMSTAARVVQRDGTKRTPQELVTAFNATRTDRLKGHDLEPVDWSDWLMGEF